MSTLPDTTPGANESTISVLDILTTLAKHKVLIIIPPLIVALLVYGAAKLLVPDVYTSTASILPPQQGGSNAAAVNGLNALGLGALAGSFGVNDPGKLYVGMLNSRTVADNLIQRLKLKEYYFEGNTEVKQEDARKYLTASTTVTLGKDGIITVEVEDEDPVMASNLTKGYIDELYQLTQTLAITEASQRRLFFEKQLTVARNGLNAAEQAFKSTQERTGLIQLAGQAQVILESIATLRAQIAAKEVEAQALSLAATDRNPQAVRIQEELKGLRVQLSRLERSQPRSSRQGDTFVGASSVPTAGLAYTRNLRDLKYYEKIYELIAQQYEIAKVDEARNSSLVQVLDAASPPEKPSGPRRSTYVIVAALLTLAVTTTIAFLQEGMKSLNPEDQLKYARLRNYLTLKSLFQKN